MTGLCGVRGVCGVYDVCVGRWEGARKAENRKPKKDGRQEGRRANKEERK